MTDSVPQREFGRRSDRPWVLPAIGAVLVVLLVVFSFLFGRTVGSGQFPANDSDEAGFARDMTEHHQQAVAMAGAVRETGNPPDLATLATDISLTQQAQAGQMQGWMAIWQLRQYSSQQSMAWMGHPGPMPGAVTKEQISEISAAVGNEKERLFLQRMIPHHEGGVSMARAVLDRTDRPEVRQLAQAIVNAQSAELQVLRDMLGTYGGQGIAPAQSMAPHMGSDPAMNH